MPEYRVTKFTYRKEVTIVQATSPEEAMLLRYMGEIGRVEFDQDIGVLKIGAEEVRDDEDPIDKKKREDAEEAWYRWT